MGMKYDECECMSGGNLYVLKIRWKLQATISTLYILITKIKDDIYSKKATFRILFTWFKYI